MKVIKIFIVAAIVFIGVDVACYAGSIGPVEPLGPMKVEISGEYNEIFGRDLEISDDVTGDEVKSSGQGYVELALGLTDWCNAYARVGFANLKEEINWDFGRNQTIQYSNGFLWGIGSNALHDIGNNFGVGGDIQFNMWFADGDSISGTNSPTLTQKGSLMVTDFQTAAYLTYTYEHDMDYKIIPYLGGYYSRFNIHYRENTIYTDDTYIYTAEGDTKGKDNFGVLLGINIPVLKNFSYKLEGRFIAETAMSVGAKYRF